MPEQVQAGGLECIPEFIAPHYIAQFTETEGRTSVS